MSNPICDPCETVAHCKQSGCVPLRTHDGGESVDLPKPSSSVETGVIVFFCVMLFSVGFTIGAAVRYFFGG